MLSMARVTIREGGALTIGGGDGKTRGMSEKEEEFIAGTRDEAGEDKLVVGVKCEAD